MSVEDENPSKHGGEREGAGRPKGTRNVLPYGTVRALTAQRLRVPKDATPEAAAVAGYSLERVVAVLEGRVRAHKMLGVLKAATILREEICGPVTKRLEVSGTLSMNVVDPYATPPTEPEASGS